MKKYIAIAVAAVTLSACSSYTITTDSLKEQFAKVDAAALQPVVVNNPLNYTDLHYNANKTALKYITVTDKNGKSESLQNSPTLEMRVILNSGKRKVLYVDTAYLSNDTLVGSASRLLYDAVMYKVPVDSIAKIEIQDGGKNYYYKKS